MHKGKKSLVAKSDGGLLAFGVNLLAICLTTRWIESEVSKGDHRLELLFQLRFKWLF